MRFVTIAARALLLWIVLMGLVTVLFVVRRVQGNAELRDALRADAGDQAWLEQLPSPDPAWRSSVARQFAKHSEFPTVDGKLIPPSLLHDTSWATRGEPMPAVVRTFHESIRSHVMGLDSLLKSNNACITSAIQFCGPLDYDPLDTGNPTRCSPRVWSPGRYVQVAFYPYIDWFAREAADAQDPAPTLKRLDKLFQAFQPAGSASDLGLLHSCSYRRDEVYVRLAVRGRLSSHQLQSWLAEPPISRNSFQSGLRGDRIGPSSSRARRALLGDTKLSKLGLPLNEAPSTLSDLRNRLGAWLEYQWRGRQDLAAAMRSNRRLESFVQGVEGAFASNLEAYNGGYVYEEASHSIASMLAFIVFNQTAHRMRRLMVRSALAATEAGHMPADETALRTMLGDHETMLRGDNWSLDIGYELLDGQRMHFQAKRESRLTPILRKLIGERLRPLTKEEQPTDDKPLFLDLEVVEYEWHP